MRESRRGGGAVAALAAAFVVAPLAHAAVGAKAPPDVTVLIREATAKVRAKPAFAKAILLEADGTPRAGKATTAGAITRWRFVFDNQPSGTAYASVFLRFASGKFGRITGERAPFLEDRRIAKPPKMTLRTAVEKLRAAGHRAPFDGVTLRYPLAPGSTEPLYLFSFRNGVYWGVGTKTGRVERIH